MSECSDFVNDEDYVPTVVIDNGSGWIKSGFAGDDAPRAVFPSIVGRPRLQGIFIGMVQKDAYVGDEAQSKRGILQVRYPIEHGVVTSWDDMEKIWHHTFYNELAVQPEEHCVLLTEPPINPKENREKMTEIMFETFQVPCFYATSRARLSLLESGKHTGLSVMSGYGVTQTVPVYEGHVLKEAVQTSHIAGDVISKQMVLLLAQRGYSLRTRAEKEIAEWMKEHFAYCAKHYDSEIQRVNESPSQFDKYWQGPCGEMVNCDIERFQCTEPMFQPRLLFNQEEMRMQYAPRNCPDLGSMVARSVAACSEDLREQMLSNIVLSGGNTLFEGMTERLRDELNTITCCKHLMNGFLRECGIRNIYNDVLNVAYDYCGVGSIAEKLDGFYKIAITAPQYRKYSVWIGGSKLASSRQFLHEWISKREYDETGPSIIHRKCF